MSQRDQNLSGNNIKRHTATGLDPHASIGTASSPSHSSSSPTGRSTSRNSTRKTSQSVTFDGTADTPKGQQGRRPGGTDTKDDFSDSEQDSDLDLEEDNMGDRRPGLHRPTDGRSHQPLLHKDDDVERGRTPYASPHLQERPPLFTRRSTMRSRSPDTQAKLATKKKYTYAAFFLGLSLVSFVIQTETAVYIQHELGWNKAYCML